MTDIVVVGSLNMDLVVKVEHMPAPGETIAGGDLHTIPGGKGGNQAAAAARLGAKVAMIGKVGQDAFGPRLLTALNEAGVDTASVKIEADTATGTAVIIVNEKGENSIVISPGANGKVSPADIDQLENVLAGAKIILLQHEIPLATVHHVIEMAARHHVTVILNPAPAESVPQAIYSKIDYFIPNETESRILTGIEVTDLASAEKAAHKFMEFGAKNVIITLGEKGALLVTPNGSTHVPSRKVKVVDTTAAGDAFIAGLANALVKGLPQVEAVRYACCAGALTVTRFGAQTSLPSEAEVDEFFKLAVEASI
jgi:ribokinase